MKRIVVTPAGRKQYMDILYEHLNAQKTDFDEWHLWVNTSSVEDIGNCERLAARNSWIVTKYIADYEPIIVKNIYRFYETCTDPEAMYLRIDDDIVWLQPGFVESMFAFREKHADNLLVSANVVNNPLTSFLHQHRGNVVYPNATHYVCQDEVGWRDGNFAEVLHRAFLESVKEGTLDTWRFFDEWLYSDYERTPINVTCWRGADFAEFGGKVGVDDEVSLSTERPRAEKKPNVVNGRALCSHFSFHTQREHLERTDLLDAYREHLPKAPSLPPSEKLESHPNTTITPAPVHLATAPVHPATAPSKKKKVEVKLAAAV